MERTTQPSPTDRSSRRTFAERGATLVEYALVFALVAVASLGAIEFLQRQSENEINNQAECVSDRPPPGDCGFAPVPSDVSFPDPGFSPPTSAPPLPEKVPTLTLGMGTEDFAGPTGWAILLPVTLTVQPSGDPQPPPEPVPNVRIRAEVRLEDPATGELLPEVWQPECITAAATGECTLRFDVPIIPPNDINVVWIRVVAADTNPPPTIAPNNTSFDRLP